MGFDLLRRAAPYLMAITLVLAAGYGCYSHGRSVEGAEWTAKWAERDSADAAARATAEQAQRTEEQRRTDWAAGVQRDATEEISRLQTGIDRATADARRLRDELASLQKRFGGTGKGPGPTISSASTTRAALVLSQLLDRCIGERQELAAAFDRSRIAGLACERSYDGLSPGPQVSQFTGQIH